MKYVVKCAEELEEMGAPPPWDEAWGDELDYLEYFGYASYVVKVTDQGDFVGYVGSDGGEPEDQTLRRNWSWVVEALNEAFENGYRTAIEDHR